jgi:bifunctional non-homologous end joining protein LigD
MESLTKVRLSNLDKILFPELRLIKKDIIEYYIRIAPRMLSFLRDRALVRVRFPEGIYGLNFYEKNAPEGTPEWVRTFSKYSKTTEGETNYVVCNDIDTLIWLANLAALELHIPLSRIPETGKPDMVLFDLDPEPPAGLMEAINVAILLKDLLEEFALESYVKTSGKKGIHVVIPLEPKYDFRNTRDFVHEIGSKMAEEHGFIVSERRQTNVPGTVLIDYPQNSERATMIAPYSLRSTREATISTPLGWKELENIHPFDFNIYSLIERKVEPWKEFFNRKQNLPY